MCVCKTYQIPTIRVVVAALRIEDPTCWEFTMMRFPDGGPFWKYGFNYLAKVIHQHRPDRFLR